MRRKVFFFVILTLSVASCTFYEPEFRGIEKIDFDGVDNRTMRIDVSAKVFNENSFALKLKPSTLDVYLDDAYLGKLSLADKVKMKRKSETVVSAPCQLELSKGALLKVIGLGMKKEVTLRLKGQVKGRALLFTKKFDVDESKTLSGDALKDFKL